MSIVSNRGCLAASIVAASLSVALASQSLSAAVYVWGANGQGQFGNGTTTSSSSPVPASSPLTAGVINGVAASVQNTYAIRDGALYAAGTNLNGQLGNGDTTGASSSTPVATLLTSGVTAVAAGQVYAIAIQNGAAYGFGFNGSGQLGNGTTAVASPTPTPVSGLTSGVTSIAAGNFHALAVQNGAVYAWGSNFRGLGNGTTLSNVPVAVTGLESGVTKVAAGNNASLAIQNGALFGWGQGNGGQLGNGSFTNPATATAIAGLQSNVTDVAVGDRHTLAVMNGQVYAFGTNTNGQLGDGTTTANANPQLIAPTLLTNIVAVAAGQFSSYALSSDGSLWVWGSNSVGQLGLGTTVTQYNTPQHLLAPEGFAYRSIDADAGGTTAIATLVAVPEPAALSLLALTALSLARRRS